MPIDTSFAGVLRTYVGRVEEALGSEREEIMIGDLIRLCERRLSLRGMVGRKVRVYPGGNHWFPATVVGLGRESTDLTVEVEQGGTGEWDRQAGARIDYPRYMMAVTDW